MRKFVGAGVLVLGVLLMMAGVNASESLSSRFSELFTGSPADKTLWLLIGGALMAIIGASAIFVRRGPQT